MDGKEVIRDVRYFSRSSVRYHVESLQATTVSRAPHRIRSQSKKRGLAWYIVGRVQLAWYSVERV